MATEPDELSLRAAARVSQQWRQRAPREGGDGDGDVNYRHGKLHRVWWWDGHFLLCDPACSVWCLGFGGGAVFCHEFTQCPLRNF